MGEENPQNCPTSGVFASHARIGAPLFRSTSLDTTQSKLKAFSLFPIEQASSGSVTMFVDGSCFGNNRRKNTGKAGIGVVFPDFMGYNISEKLPGENATNNRAELYAIIRGFEIIDRDIDPQKRKHVIVKSDSELSMNICNKWLKQWKRRGWKKADNQIPSNLDLLLQLDKMLDGRNVTVKHVRAHTLKTDEDSLMNARADALAKAGASM